MRFATVPLKHLADVRVSNVDKKSVDGEVTVRLVNYTDVYYGDRIRPGADLMTATATHAQVSAFRLAPGDVPITKDSETADDIGVPAYIDLSADDLVLGYHLALLRGREGQVGRFLYWVMCSDPIRGQLETGATGVTRFGLRRDAIKDLVVPAWPVGAQQVIADYLDTETARIDALIAKKRHLATEVRARYRRNRWARVTAGLEGLAARSVGPPKVRSSSNGWREGRLRDLVESPVGGIWGGDVGTDEVDVACVRVADFDRQSAVVRFDEPTARSITFTQLQKLQLEVGDLVIEKSGGGDRQPVGFVARFVGPAGPAVTSNFVARLRPAGLTESNYAAHVFAAIYDHGLNIPYVKQTTGIQNLDVGRFLDQPWAIPDPGEQVMIAAELDRQRDQVGAVVRALDRQVELLEEHRKALITAAVTGELEIRGVAA